MHRRLLDGYIPPSGRDLPLLGVNASAPNAQNGPLKAAAAPDSPTKKE
jgi:hypothetical protein